MDFKIVTIANNAYKTFTSRYLVENRGVSNNVTEQEEKDLLLPLFTESLPASKELAGVQFVETPSSANLTASGLNREISALVRVLERALELFLDGYGYSFPRLFTALSAKPSILYQVCLLTASEFFKNYRVDPVQFGYVIVSLSEEEAKRERGREEEARIQGILDAWKKAEDAYVEGLDLNASRLYYVNKNDGFLPECLKEAYTTAKPYLDR